MALDHALRILGGIVPGRKDLLLYSLQHLEAEHFVNEVYRVLFQSIEAYYNVAADVLPLEVLGDLLAGSKTLDTAKTLLYEETYRQALALEISDHEFKYSIDALKAQREHQLTGEAITTAFEILERGAEVGKERLEGAKDARFYALSEFADIDKMNNSQAAPEGDMRTERDEILAEYIDRKTGVTEPGILTGIPSVDKTGLGFSRGELALVCAYTNQGKSQLLCQIAWDAAVKQGKNVYFATSETVRTTIRRRIVARHSRLPQFNLPKGLDTKDIKNGSLSVAEEHALKESVDDLLHNPNYGKIYIAQIPRGATLSYLEARMNRQASMWSVDLCLIDYLALLKAERKRNSEREEFNETLKDAKVYATSFDDGRGVPIISPWQIKQEAYKQAQMTGAYGLASLSDTSEAEKSPDTLMTLLNVPESPNTLSLQFLKLRDGEIPNAIPIQTDFRNAYFADKASGFGGSVASLGGVFGF